uniref:Uncharacterized protein n=1 Tax=Anguilla anguilla TaxID=7936 RepID=A0A0E9VTB7_ANGAN
MTSKHLLPSGFCS